MQAKAAVFAGIPGALALESIDIPEPRGAEILVRVLGCTLCGSDLHTFDGRREVPCPTILGHEIVGEIAVLGPAAPGDVEGRSLSVGDRVTWAIVASCGSCFFCLRDLPQKCLNAVKYGHERMEPGTELRGGLAEYCLLAPGTAVVRLPESLSLAVACPVSCATATVAAALEAAGPLSGSAVCITGAGMLGLTACAMARASGADVVCCVEPVATRRDQARLFGATHPVEPERLDQLRDEPRLSRGFDSLLEFSGIPAAFTGAWPLLRLGGTAVLVGSVFPSTPVPMALEQIVRRNLSVRGIHNYAPRHLQSAVQFLAAHQQRFPFATLADEWWPLDAIRDAFAAAQDPSRIRVGVRLQDDLSV